MQKKVYILESEKKQFYVTHLKFQPHSIKPISIGKLLHETPASERGIFWRHNSRPRKYRLCHASEPVKSASIGTKTGGPEYRPLRRMLSDPTFCPAIGNLSYSRVKIF